MRLRLCFLECNLETQTSVIGVRVGTATAKALSNAIFPIGDPNAAVGGAWTQDEIAGASLPLTLFNLFPDEDLHWLEASAIYPEYVMEFDIAANQVVEMICRTADDSFDLRLGYYSTPLV